MEVLVSVLLVGAALAGGYKLLRRRRTAGKGVRPLKADQGAEHPKALAAPRELGDLLPDDVLIVDDRDFLVTGMILLTDGSSTWRECRMEDGGDERWVLLSAGSGDWIQVGQPVSNLGLDGPPSEQLEVGGAVYRLIGQGSAEVKEEAGDLAGGVFDGRCRYWDYSRPGAGRLWIRQGRQGRIITVGRRIQRHLVDFLPGS